jgi:hypothetical protein
VQGQHVSGHQARKIENADTMQRIGLEDRSGMDGTKKDGAPVYEAQRLPANTFRDDRYRIFLYD